MRYNKDFYTVTLTRHKYRQTQIHRHPQILPTKVREQKFPFYISFRLIATLDTPLQIAVNTQWCYSAISEFGYVLNCRLFTLFNVVKICEMIIFRTFFVVFLDSG